MLPAYVAAALFGTALWAVDLAANPVDVRIPLLVGGVLSAASLAVVPLSGAAPPIHVSVRLGILLYAYQHALSTAFELGGAEIQAIVNCNVVLICLVQVFLGHTALTPALGALAFATCFFSGALVVYMARERKMDVPLQNSADDVAVAPNFAVTSAPW